MALQSLEVHQGDQWDRPDIRLSLRLWIGTYKFYTYICYNTSFIVTDSEPGDVQIQC